MSRKHIKQIDALIPAALLEAKVKAKEHGKSCEIRHCKTGKYNHVFFTEYFHQAMNRMASEAGLRVL
ncbi:MAG: hypothetical protein HGJ94_18370 [Desulfosarcina sp.]|nr:hypothetical protein [Desulfosarcina sp.]